MKFGFHLISKGVYIRVTYISMEIYVSELWAYMRGAYIRDFKDVRIIIQESCNVMKDKVTIT